MLLVINIGNSSLAFGIFNKTEYVDSFRLSSKIESLKSYVSLIEENLKSLNINKNDIERTIICSVVPDITEQIEKIIINHFCINTVVLRQDNYCKLPIDIVNPKEVGCDLIANSMAVWQRKKGACIVVDFGTALSFTSVNAKGSAVGVAIAPGLYSALDVLALKGALLPKVNIAIPETVLGRTTEEAIQAGVVVGYIGLVEYLVKRIKKELGSSYVVFTGGLCHLLENETDIYDEICPNFTLEGIASMESFLFD